MGDAQWAFWTQRHTQCRSDAIQGQHRFRSRSWLRHYVQLAPFFTPCIHAPISNAGKVLGKKQGAKMALFWGPPVLILQKAGPLSSPRFLSWRLQISQIVTRADVNGNSGLEVVQLLAGAAASKQAAPSARPGRDSLPTVLRSCKWSPRQ